LTTLHSFPTRRSSDLQPHLDGRGYLDEEPQHEVNISSGFKISATPVTNAQYEEFDPDHALLRDKLGFSSEDDEAVVFVSWHDARSEEHTSELQSRFDL